MRERTGNMRRRFNSSMGARMGIGMGLSMLSSHAPQEIQGALSMGGMAAMINPLVGLGIAGLGTAMKSENAGIAALGGAGGGAALGFQTAGVPGAVAGAVLGGFYGLLSAGVRKAARERKYARQAGSAAASAIMDTMFGNLSNQASTFGGGVTALPENLRRAANIQGNKDLANEAARLWGLDTSISRPQTEKTKRGRANKAAQGAFIENLLATGGKDQGGFDLEQVLKEGKYGAFLASYGNQLGDEMRAMEFTIDTGERRLGRLATNMGMTNIEIMNMAEATGTNLYDATKSYGELAESIAKGLMHTVNDLQNAAGDRFGTRGNLFETEIDRLDAPHIMDEIQTNLLTMLADGDWDEATALQEMDRLQRAYISFAGGDEMLAERMMAASLGGEGTAWRAGGEMGPEMLAMLQQSGAFNTWQAGITSSPMTQNKDMREALMGNLMTAGFGATEGGESMSMQLMRMLGPGASFEDLMKVRSSGLLEQSTYFDAETGDRKTADQIAQLFSNAGLADLLVMQTSDTTPAEAIKDSSVTFKEAVEKFAGKIDEILQQTDTSTPRRKMVGMRGLLAKRSSMFMPGSSDSDHLAGAATDFYGSGLGAVESVVQAAGGFAERHGRGPSRHLHAVEGGGGEGSTSNYTINVTGGASASPAEIADEVMYRIQRQQTNIMQRT